MVLIEFVRMLVKRIRFTVRSSDCKWTDRELRVRSHPHHFCQFNLTEVLQLRLICLFFFSSVFLCFNGFVLCCRFFFKVTLEFVDRIRNVMHCKYLMMINIILSHNCLWLFLMWFYFIQTQRGNIYWKARLNSLNENENTKQTASMCACVFMCMWKSDTILWYRQ